MNVCEQPYLSMLPSKYNSSNYCIEDDDWRPIQEILLTRFTQVEYSDKFRTINQDYGSFYYRKPASPCIPDILKEKNHRRQERFMNWLVTQTAHRQSQNDYKTNLSPHCHTETVTVTHRKKLSGCHVDEIIIDFLVKQIQQRLKDLIDPSDYQDVFACAKLLITELLTKEPSLCAEDVINRVIAIMNTPFYCVNTDSNIINQNTPLFTIQNSPTILTNECSPVTPPSSSLLPSSNPVFDG